MSSDPPSSPTAKELALQQRVQSLRDRVRILDYNTQPRFARTFLFWLAPLTSLGKYSNLSYADIPISPSTSTTKWTRPIFYSHWNAAVERLQRLNHKQIRQKYQDQLDAYQKSRAIGATPSDSKRVRRPKELPDRLNNIIPTTVYSVEELNSIPKPQPFEFGNVFDGVNDVAVTSHFKKHPAISVLEEFYQQDKLPLDIPEPIHDSSHPTDNGDTISLVSSGGNSSSDVEESKNNHKGEKIQDSLGDLHSPKSASPPTPTQSTTSTDSQSQVAYTINGQDNFLRDTKEKQPSGAKVILTAYKNPILVAFCAEIVFVAANLSQPWGVKKLANYFSQYRSDASAVSTAHGVFYSLLLCFITASAITSVVFKIHNQMHWAARSSLSYLQSVFHKLLRVAPYSLANDSALSSGTIINLVSQDSNVPFNVMIHVLHVVSGPIMIILALLLLSMDDYGSSALVTVGLMLFLFPYQFAMAKLRHWLRSKWLKSSDVRINGTLNILSGLRIAKIYSWEKKLQDELQALRDAELKRMRISNITYICSDIFIQIYPLFVTYCTIAHYVSRADTQFTSTQVVVLLSYLNAMRLPISFLGMAIQSMIELYLSGQRIGHFLSKEELPIHQEKIKQSLIAKQTQNNLSSSPSTLGKSQSFFDKIKSKKTQNYQQFKDEEDDNNNNNNNPGYNTSQHVSYNPTPSPRTPVRHNSDPFSTPFIGIDDALNQPLLKISNVDFYWSSFEQTPHQTPVLSNISLELRRGEIFGLISHSGLGKSALLQGIFGELYPQPHRCHSGLTSIANLPQGDVEVEGMFTFSFNNRIEIIPTDLINLNGRIAYCAQTPWILNDTIMNNIIMDLPFDGGLFKQAIAAASLGPDLEIFPDGHYTLVSEQGVSLSGGQQARLQFARVLYHVLSGVIDIVILDDIFAAVDHYVARNMFFRGVCGIIQPKCGVLMALNSHYEYLENCTQTMMLDSSNDTYWLVLHQYILTKQTALINKKLVQKVLENEHGDYQKSYSVLGSRTQSSLTFSGSNNSLDYSDSDGAHQESPRQTGVKTHGFSTPQRTPLSSHHQTPLAANPPTNFPKTPSLATIPDNKPLHQQDTKTVIHPSEIYIDPLRLQGFRQPSTITFIGPITDLMKLNIPLLSNFVQASKTEEDEGMTDAGINGNTDGVGEDGSMDVDAGKEKEQANKLEHKIEGHQAGGKSAGTPTQAQLPSWLYLYWFQGSRQQFGLCLVFGLFVAASILSQVFRTGSDVWLVEWAQDESRLLERTHSRSWWLATTAIGLVCCVICFLIQGLVYLYVWIDASRHIHKTAVSHIFRATIQWLDVTPLGQIVNKIAGKDIEILDSTLPDNLLFVVQNVLILSGIVTLSFFTTWLFIIPLIPFMAVLYYLRKGYHLTSIQVRRIESSTLSPIYSLFGSVARGTAVIRAYGYEEVFLKKYNTLVDKYIQVKLISAQLERRFAFSLNMVASVYIFFVSTTVVLARDHLNTELGMLAITYSLRLIGLLQMCIRFYTSATQSMTAVQRIEALSHIPQEREYYTSPEFKEVLFKKTPPEIKKFLSDPKAVPESLKNSRQLAHLRDHYFFPWRGVLEFKNVSLRYRPDLPLVISNLNIRLEAGTSVGVLGRTGSGKSTLIQSLFSILIPETGTIEIDGIDIQKLGISDLRSRIALVPQTPTLFIGTVRSSLDPLGKMTDEDLFRVLDWVHLSNKVNQLGNGLDSAIEEGGGNLSASERQLLCIGRALLTQFRGNLPDEFPQTGSILVTDEATASIPNDELINSTIGSIFQNSTRLIIAHRLQTVINLDKILVLRPLTDEDVANNVSSLVEFDIPWLLLNSDSEFKKMCMNAGENIFASLYQTAKETYFQRILPEQTSQIVDGSSTSFNGRNTGSGRNSRQGLLPIPIADIPIFPSSDEPIPSQLGLRMVDHQYTTALDSSLDSIDLGARGNQNMSFANRHFGGGEINQDDGRFSTNSTNSNNGNLPPKYNQLDRDSQMPLHQSDLRFRINDRFATPMAKSNLQDEIYQVSQDMGLDLNSQLFLPTPNASNLSLQQLEDTLLSPDAFAPQDTHQFIFSHTEGLRDTLHGVMNPGVDDDVTTDSYGGDGGQNGGYFVNDQDGSPEQPHFDRDTSSQQNDPFFLSYMINTGGQADEYVDQSFDREESGVRDVNNNNNNIYGN